MSLRGENSAATGEGFWKTLLRPHNMALWGSGAIVLLIVTVISEISGEGGIVAVIGRSIDTLATEFGFALLIAAFLSASIEEFTRRRFRAEVDSRMNDVQKNVFRSTYSRNLPDQFFNEVEELLFQSKFLYSNYRIEYDFRGQGPLAETGSPQMMNVTIKHIFSVRNLTAFASEHCIRIQIQELPYLEDQCCAKIRSVILYGSATFEQEEIDKINTESESDSGTRTFRIQADEVPPGDSMQAEITAQTTTYTDGFAFCRCWEPSNQLTVVAKFQPGIDLDRVGADTVHRTTCKLISGEHAENELSWVIEGAVLPTQGINFWWAL